jgi:hypothetical protein
LCAVKQTSHQSFGGFHQFRHPTPFAPLDAGCQNPEDGV